MQPKFRVVSVCLALLLGWPLGLSYSADSNEALDMIRVPAGVFIMGSHDGPEDERPQQRVHLGEFFIDRTKVTHAQFARFIDARGVKAADGQRWYDVDDNDARIHWLAHQWQVVPGHENHPVVEASWYGAVAYCAWIGKRLPTEAEWEKAARGTDGRKYPWGNQAADQTRAHFNGGWNDFRPVGSFPKGASPYGMLDAAGNGWEWVSSAYLPYPYGPDDGREDLARMQVRVTRGGGQDSSSDELTTTHRGGHVSRNPRGGHHNIGFRCAR